MPAAFCAAATVLSADDGLDKTSWLQLAEVNETHRDWESLQQANQQSVSWANLSPAKEDQLKNLGGSVIQANTRVETIEYGSAFLLQNTQGKQCFVFPETMVVQGLTVISDIPADGEQQLIIVYQNHLHNKDNIPYGALITIKTNGDEMECDYQESSENKVAPVKPDPAPSQKL